MLRKSHNQVGKERKEETSLVDALRARGLFKDESLPAHKNCQLCPAMRSCSEMAGFWSKFRCGDETP